MFKQWRSRLILAHGATKINEKELKMKRISTKDSVCEGSPEGNHRIHSAYHVCRDNDVPVTDGVVRIHSPVLLLRRDKDAFRLTDEDCRHIVAANRCNAIVCACGSDGITNYYGCS